MQPAAMMFLHRQFEHQAAACPDAVAISGYGGQLRYQQLDERANRLAAALADAGIGSGSVVGLCVDWPPDFLIAMLAVLKAGAAYMPMDPLQPEPRRNRQLEAADPALIVTSDAWVELFDPAACACLNLDELALDKTGPVPDIRREPDAQDLCYVMFTSGSGGQPKGVMVTHGNVAGLFDGFRERFDFSPDDVWSKLHSFAFGYSVWEIWGALCHGARLAFASPDQRRDPDALRDFLQHERVTVLSQTPSAFRQSLLSDAFADLHGLALQLVVLSGEAVSGPDIRRWFSRHRDTGPRLIDTYALTETAGQVCCREHRYGQVVDAGLGPALPGVELAVLDDSGQPAVEGELYVSGPGVARGYIGDAALTTERFVELTLDGSRPRRYYRTGDRVRRLPDGSVQYLSRQDAQIKWHGHRIEPAEIESALVAHPAVREAVVALKGGDDSARLVAYYSCDTDAQPVEDPDAPQFWPSVGPYQVYDGFLYDLMTAETGRVECYRRALQRHAKGRVVLDIGTGEHAVLARQAAEAGARHVYAVEILPEAARRARALVDELGLASQITVIDGDVAEIELPEPVGLATQGIIGNIGSADGIVPIWTAAQRWFAADCIALPRRCRTLIAPAELPEALYRRPAFGALAQSYVERVFERQGGPFDVRLCVQNFPASGLLAPAQIFEDLDFSTVLQKDDRGIAQFDCSRDGRIDGFLLWTVVDVDHDVTVDYFGTQQAWLPVFIPLPGGGVEIRTADRIAVRWQRRTTDDICPDYLFDGELAGQHFHCASRVHEHAYNGSWLHRQLWNNPPVDAMPVTGAKLRDWLGERLPAYMLPNAWMQLPSLPLNASGKVDRNGLPAPSRARPGLSTPWRAPRTAIEHELAALWSDALDIEPVGVDDNFFDLGGDSISAVRLVSAIQRSMNRPVGLAAIFDAPTIAQLAELLQTFDASKAVVFEEGEL
ncbi:MAG TPA: amino acid adenylation domain-containing protein [Chromatiales bacterium]|nr:amino acid adenylation domain-containing protein [Chromatiales bacterium]